MRSRIEVTYVPGTRTISTGISDLTIDDINVIINETQCLTLCSPVAKFLISDITDGDVTYVDSYNDDGEVVTLPVIAEGDHIRVEIDRCTTAEDIKSAIDNMTDELGNLVIMNVNEYQPALNELNERLNNLDS